MSQLKKLPFTNTASIPVNSIIQRTSVEDWTQTFEHWLKKTLWTGFEPRLLPHTCTHFTRCATNTDMCCAKLWLLCSHAVTNTTISKQFFFHQWQHILHLHFTFMHLAETAFQSGYIHTATVYIYIYIYIYAFSRRFYPKRLTLHSSYSFTFYQLLLSLGVEPMILALLAPCSTIWATGKPCILLYGLKDCESPKSLNMGGEWKLTWNDLYRTWKCVKLGADSGQNIRAEWRKTPPLRTV